MLKGIIDLTLDVDEWLVPRFYLLLLGTCPGTHWIGAPTPNWTWRQKKNIFLALSVIDFQPFSQEPITSLTNTLGDHTNQKLIY
jgi:hypothetical protein